jgi:hypothetical protein
MKLYNPERHEALTKTQWSAERATQKITNLVEQCLREFEGENLWPVHPDGVECYKLKEAASGVWMGAAGTLWALHDLWSAYPNLPKYDFTPYLPLLKTQQARRLEPITALFPFDVHAPGYLFGYVGSALVRWLYTREDALLDELASYITDCIMLPENEFMWGASGGALVAWCLYQQTGQERWADLFRRAAEQIFATWEKYPDATYQYWEQHMYKMEFKLLGLVHGASGNISVLLQGFTLLTKAQQERLIEQGTKTFVQSAQQNEQHANWWADVRGPQTWAPEMFLQLCHGAPAMLISMAKLWPHFNDEARSIFTKGAQLIWDAGPLVKPWGLCHGTAGNGYAFLKMYELTNEQHWLDKARAFAMHAIEQSEAMQEKYGQIRTDSWCGDMGLATYLKDCLRGSSGFPMLDYF